MSIKIVEIYEDGTESESPEEVFYSLHPECMPLWMKIKAIIRWILAGAK